MNDFEFSIFDDYIYIRLLAILGYSQYETEDVVLCTRNVSLITLGLGRVG